MNASWNGSTLQKNRTREGRQLWVWLCVLVSGTRGRNLTPGWTLEVWNILWRWAPKSVLGETSALSTPRFWCASSSAGKGTEYGVALDSYCAQSNRIPEDGQEIPLGETNPGMACLQCWVTVPEQTPTHSPQLVPADCSYPGGADTLALIPELAHKVLLSPHVEPVSFRCLET